MLRQLTTHRPSTETIELLVEATASFKCACMPRTPKYVSEKTQSRWAEQRHPVLHCKGTPSATTSASLPVRRESAAANAARYDGKKQAETVFRSYLTCALVYSWTTRSQRRTTTGPIQRRYWRSDTFRDGSRISTLLPFFRQICVRAVHAKILFGVAAPTVQTKL